VLKKFHALDNTGVARVGESLAQGDVFINKYVPSVLGEGNATTNTANVEYKPRPESYKGPNPSYVDRVIMTST
jgi:DNA-directed RNA polymerase III subunit RPC2